MATSQICTGQLTAEARDFYCRVLVTLAGAGVPALVGGAYAFARYTGIERHTKDFDIFLRRGDVGDALRALHGASSTAPATAWPRSTICGSPMQWRTTSSTCRRG
jgi:hypothetical protein